MFVPRWWQWIDPGGWTACDGAADGQRWMNAAYADRTLVTRLGPVHADHAGRPTTRAGGLPHRLRSPAWSCRCTGTPASPTAADILDVGTGSGYGCALLARRLGDHRVTSVDVDDHQVKAAAERLAGIGLHPDIAVRDATGLLPGSYDRIVSMMSVAPIPASWLAALRSGRPSGHCAGRTGLIVTADKTPDGGAAGRTEWDRAGFMAARSGPDYPPRLLDEFPGAREADGEQVSIGRYPVLRISSAWELWSMLGVTVPGVQDHYEVSADGERTAWLLHPDGSWTRAAGTAVGLPVVHQSGSAPAVGHGGRYPLRLAAGRQAARLRSRRRYHP